MNKERHISTSIANVFRDIGVTLGSIFNGKSDFNTERYFNYNPLSIEEGLKKDTEALKKDWEAIGFSSEKHM